MVTPERILTEDEVREQIADRAIFSAWCLTELLEREILRDRESPAAISVTRYIQLLLSEAHAAFTLGEGSLADQYQTVTGRPLPKMIPAPSA